MSLELRPVTRDNWHALVKLKVRDDQKGFVASNLYSIAEAQFGFEEEGRWNLFPFGVYVEDEPVGFAMTGLNYSHSQFQGLILRLMVDEKYQGMGYGRAAMESMLASFRADECVRVICITYEPENDPARQLYASLGFEENGELMENEVVALLRIR